MDPIYRQLPKSLEKNEPLAFAVLVETQDSTLRKRDAKAIFLPDHLHLLVTRPTT